MLKKYHLKMKKIYQSTPGSTLSEKILHYPERMVKELPEQRKLAFLVKHFADDVARTPFRYILSDEVAGASLAISETRCENLAKVIPHIVLPHRKFLIEFNEKGRVDFSNVAGLDNKEPRDIFPDHTAYLVTSDATGRAGSIDLISIDRRGVIPNPFSLRFNLDDPHFAHHPIDKKDYTRVRTDAPKFLNNSAMEPTISWLSYTQAQLGPPYRGLTAQSVSMEDVGSPEQLANRLGELSREFRSFLSIMGMICLRNGVNLDTAPQASAARPSSGSLGRRLELNQSTMPSVIRMYMSLSRDLERQSTYAARMSSGKGLHWVCGHFKVRKTGIYWWSPHLRGDPAKDLTKVPREILVRNPQDPDTFPTI